MTTPVEKKNTSMRLADETQGLIRQLQARVTLSDDRMLLRSVDQDVVLLAALRMADTAREDFLILVKRILDERK